MAVTLNASTSSGLVQSADTSGVIELQSNGTTALTVNTNEGIQILNCLGVGNATPSTSGAGITFPATQSASSDANTLDDYEEGTFTPSINFGGGTTGITGTFAGFYTKTGNQVFVTILINLSNKGSSTGSFYIAGLPFTSNSNANYRATSTSILWNDLATSFVFVLGLIGPSATQMEILGATAASNTNATNVLNTNINNATSLRLSITYQV